MAISREDWTLLTLAAAQGATLSPVQLQKALFVLGKEMPGSVAGNFYDFKPYNYGPFDGAVYQDAEKLEAKGLARILSAERWSEYAATPAGLTRADELRAQADPRAMAFLSTVVQWARSLSFSDLVRAIYAKYPEMRAKSIFDAQRP
jgi:hypothetical protein